MALPLLVAFNATVILTVTAGIFVVVLVVWLVHAVAVGEPKTHRLLYSVFGFFVAVGIGNQLTGVAWPFAAAGTVAVIWGIYEYVDSPRARADLVEGSERG